LKQIFFLTYFAISRHFRFSPTSSNHTYVVMRVGLREAATPCALTVHNVQYFGIARQQLVL
jgi:hypothetical protein